MFKEVLAAAGGADRIRGFALNVSNYDPPREPKAQKSGPDDPSQDEIGYAGDLAAGLAKVGITGKGFIIDTSRNGRGGIRSTPGNWCNVKGAGLGERPASRPRRTSTPTSGSRRRASPTAPPIARRRASTKTASPTTPCPARPKPASCSPRT